MDSAAPASATASIAVPARSARQPPRVLAIQVLTITALLLLWQLVSLSGVGLAELFPPLQAIAESFWSIVSHADILPHLGTSGYEVFLGFALGAAPGVIFGLLAALNSYPRRVFEPLILYFAAVPHIILFPIFILVFTIGPNSKVAVAAASSFFPVAINTMAAVYSVRPVHIKVGQTLRLSRVKLLRYIYLPSMISAIMVGLRLGFGSAIVGALLAETRAANQGLGFLVTDAYSKFDISRMYALLVLIFVLAAVLNSLLTLASGSRVVRKSNVSGFLA